MASNRNNLLYDPPWTAQRSLAVFCPLLREHGCSIEHQHTVNFTGVVMAESDVQAEKMIKKEIKAFVEEAHSDVSTVDGNAGIRVSLNKTCFSTRISTSAILMSLNIDGGRTILLLFGQEE